MESKTDHELALEGFKMADERELVENSILNYEFQYREYERFVQNLAEDREEDRQMVVDQLTLFTDICQNCAIKSKMFDDNCQRIKELQAEIRGYKCRLKGSENQEDGDDSEVFCDKAECRQAQSLINGCSEKAAALNYSIPTVNEGTAFEFLLKCGLSMEAIAKMNDPEFTRTHEKRCLLMKTVFCEPKVIKEIIRKNVRHLKIDLPKQQNIDYLDIHKAEEIFLAMNSPIFQTSTPNQGFIRFQINQ